MRVLVTGSRNWPEPDLVYSELNQALGSCLGNMTLVQGDCPTGADCQAKEWALWKNSMGHQIVVESHPTDWSKGRGAGFARNAEMVKLGVDACLAFIHDDSRGASHTDTLARKASIPTRTYRSYSVGINDSNVIIEGARLVFKNFAGEERKYNAKGNRNFSVVLDDEQAEKMKQDGWKVKSKPPREDGDSWFHHLPVAVKFEFRPPRMFLITKVLDRNTKEYVQVRIPVGEEECEMFDWADASNIDVILRPSKWSVNGNNGIKAYLHAIYLTLNQDALELKYDHLPEVSSRGEQLALEKGYDEDDDDIEDAEVIEDVE